MPAPSLLDGEAARPLKMHVRARRGLSRTWQNLRLFHSLSVIDNLMVGVRDYKGERLTNVPLCSGRACDASERRAQGEGHGRFWRIRD